MTIETLKNSLIRYLDIGKIDEAEKVRAKIKELEEKDYDTVLAERFKKLKEARLKTLDELTAESQRLGLEY